MSVSIQIAASTVALAALAGVQLHQANEQAQKSQERFELVSVELAKLRVATEASIDGSRRQALKDALRPAPQARRHYELLDIKSLDAADLPAFDDAAARGCVVQAVGLSRAGLDATWTALLLCGGEK